MKQRYWLICLLLLLVLVGCQSPPDSETATPTPEESGIFPRPTVTPRGESVEESPADLPEGYPAPPLPTATPEGYPPPATPLPTIDPYPAGGFVWVIRPLGEQCADPEDNTYVDLQEAVAALAAAGVPVKSASMVELMVCAACDCPTSAHFQAQIESINLDKAEAMGWIETEQEQ